MGTRDCHTTHLGSSRTFNAAVLCKRCADDEASHALKTHALLVCFSHSGLSDYWVMRVWRYPGLCYTFIVSFSTNGMSLNVAIGTQGGCHTDTSIREHFAQLRVVHSAQRPLQHKASIRYRLSTASQRYNNLDGVFCTPQPD